MARPRRRRGRAAAGGPQPAGALGEGDRARARRTRRARPRADPERPRDLVQGGLRRARRAHRRTRAPRGDRPIPRSRRRPDRPCDPSRGARRRPRRRDGVRVSLQRRAAALLDRLQRDRRTAGLVVLRHAGLGSAAGELRRDCHGPDPARALVQARALADAHRQRTGAAVVERLDVRVLHAAARDARLSRHAPRRDLPRRRRAPDPVRTSARACPGASPSRRTTRRTSSGTISTARSACRGSASSGASPTTSSSPRTRAARGAARAARRAAQPGAARGRGPGRPLWVLRSDRLHARAEPRRVAGRRAADLHGAPPGHEPRRPRQRAARRADAAAIPRRSARAGRRPAAAGTHPAPRAAEEPADRNRRSRPDGPAGRAVACAATRRRTRSARARTCSRTGRTS